MGKEEKKSRETAGMLAGLIRSRRSDRRCFVGFDGYIDELYEVVQRRDSAAHYVKCETIEALGRRILDAAGKSADIEIVRRKTKIGGNAPILANALATLGFGTVCVGQMDHEKEGNPFLQMHPACQKISTGDASKTIALEFSDGKIMLGDLRGNDLTWDGLKRRAGEETLRRKMGDSSLLCFVNWGGFYHMNDILRGLFREILLPFQESSALDRDIFIDLSDPSARSEADVSELLDIIGELSCVYRVTLGMNENEAEKIGRKCSGRSGMEEIGEQMRAKLGLYQLVIHMNHKSCGFREGVREEFTGMHVEKPVQSTGAGDHFNAGFCMGMLEALDLQSCLILGQAMASCYVETGATATRERLAQYMEKYSQTV